MNYQPVTTSNQYNLSAGFQEQFDAEKAREEIKQQYVLFLVWSSGSTNPHNTDGDSAFDAKEPEFDEKKPEFEVNVSLSCSAQSKKQDDKTKREAKGKSHFWTSVAVKKVNDFTRLQALVDKKKVVITEATIRDALRSDNAEGVECLPNEEIFLELARMGYEKPSTKLTFYKAFFSSQWKFLIHTILQYMSAKLTS
nr:hypothetical protein [Tanacetum cinerariifolium]